MRLRIYTQLFSILILTLLVTKGMGQNETDLEKLKAQIISEQPYEAIYDHLNEKFPLMKMAKLDGNSLQTTELIGKKTLINFWFTNCQPCLDEIPILNEIKNEMNSEKFNFLAITFQDEAEIKEFLKSNDYHYIHIVNSRNLIDSLGVRFYPKTVILDQELNMIRIEKRIPVNSSEPEIEIWKQEIINNLKMN